MIKLIMAGSFDLVQVLSRAITPLNLISNDQMRQSKFSARRKPASQNFGESLGDWTGSFFGNGAIKERLIYT